MRTSNVLVADGYSLTAHFLSNAISIKHLEGFSVQATFSGSTPTGSLSIEVSNDSAEGLGATPTNWTTFAPSGFPISVSSATTYIGNVSACYYKWVRIRYTRSGGSSTMTLRFNGKGPGE
jgi:hypothetical protein